MTVAQLEQMLSTEKAAHKSDIEIARKISDVELSERLTDLALGELSKNIRQRLPTSHGVASAGRQVVFS